MAQIKQEQGRSMVEMLGTLAIIGVLSVGGIAGYTYAMNRYYTNEILAGASARAVIVASQIASGRELSLSEFDKMETAGGKFTGTVKKFDDGLGIKVSGVKKSVCENLIKDIEDTDIGIETEAGGEVTCGDENSFYITFASFGGGNSDGSVANCWVSDTCTEADADGDDTWCDGGMYFYEYCSCRSYGGTVAECIAWGNPEKYEICRKSGKSSIYCTCKWNNGTDEDCARKDECFATYSADYCNCTLGGYPEAVCAEYKTVL